MIWFDFKFMKTETPRTAAAWDAAERASRYGFGDCIENKWRNVALDMRDHAKKLELECAEMTARAMSLVVHLPPETLAGDVQKWRDEAKTILSNQSCQTQRSAERKKDL